MINLEIFRLELNYLFSLIQTKLGEEERGLTEVAFDILMSYYILGNNDEFVDEYLKRINDNLSKLNHMEDLECNRLSPNIPSIIKFLDILKFELK
ncbi:MAG: hypothetical protein FH753_11190 [Firmicutes bacterium]|nr:hypothetical protein [Bacillota bacterium]